MAAPMEPKDISSEVWREYDIPARPTPYVIERPLKLWIGETTHRVLDSKGFVHCVPAPGYHGCVLRWCPGDAANPVQF